MCKFFCLSLILLHLTGCGIPYYTKAGYNQFRILLSRSSIEKALENPEVTPELKHKLMLTTEARNYAKKIELNPQKTFLTYATRKNIPTVWVVTAAKKYELKAHLWDFPIVGELPYKGFFSKKDAEDEMILLQEQGYDVSLRSTAAYSTLGWFNDPVMPSTLALDDIQLFNTVVHEITHTTFWIPGSAAYNETMAHTVGLLATLSFFNEKTLQTKAQLTKEVISANPHPTHHIHEHDENFNKAKELFLRECHYAKGFKKAKTQLEKLFSTDISDVDKETKKQKIYAALGMKPNNALFMGYYTYLDRFHYFLKLFAQEKDVENYIKALRKHASNIQSSDPYTELLTHLESMNIPDVEKFDENLCQNTIIPFTASFTIKDEERHEVQ